MKATELKLAQIQAKTTIKNLIMKYILIQRTQAAILIGKRQYPKTLMDHKIETFPYKS